MAALSGQTARFLQTAIADTGCGLELMNLVNQADAGASPVLVSITTAGAGTLTAAGIVGQIILRSGPTGAFTDTTDTAANIVTALGVTAQVGITWELKIQNSTIYAGTLSAGSGVTLAGLTVVPPLSTLVVHCNYTAAGAITMTGICAIPLVQLPPAQYTKNTTSGATTAAAGDLTGANFVNAEYSAVGAANLATRTAAQMFGDIPNCQVGFSYTLMITNTSGGTTTLTAGSNVTLTGTMTMATNTTRTFNVKFPSATTCTIQSVGVGTIS